MGVREVCGIPNQSKLPAFYSLCDVFVLPSMREPWGLVVNEAMNAGRAVVVSDEVGSHKDLAETQNGWVFPAGNARALYQRLGECLDDQARVREVGEASLDIMNGWGIEGLHWPAERHPCRRCHKVTECDCPASNDVHRPQHRLPPLRVEGLRYGANESPAGAR